MLSRTDCPCKACTLLCGFQWFCMNKEKEEPMELVISAPFNPTHVDGSNHMDPMTGNVHPVHMSVTPARARSLDRNGEMPVLQPK